MNKTIIFFLSLSLILISSYGSTGSSSNSTNEEELRKSLEEVHKSWFDGLLEENYALIDQILSEDITLGFPGDNVMPRQEFIGHLKNGTLFYDRASHE